MPQSTADLPFLVVHGAYVWIPLMAAILAGVYALCRLSRRRSAREAVAAAPLRVVREGDGDGGIVVLEGTLASAGAASTDALAATLRAEAIDPTQRTISHWRTGELWLHTADKRVRLEGDILVEAGGQAAATHNGVPALVSDAHLVAAREAAPWLHRIRSFGMSEIRTASVAVARPGDRVVVRGRLESGPSSEPSSYREAELAWVLRPAALDAPLRLAARAPAPAVLRMDRGLLSLVLGFTALAVWIAMGVLDDRWYAQCEAAAAASHPDAPLELTNGHACALAAALPGTRKKAIEHLSELLAEHPYRDEASVRRLVAIEELRDGCGATPELLLAHAQPEAALEAARACRDLPAQRTALAALGRFDEAARIEVPHDLDSYPRTAATTMLLAAGRWTEAAARVDEVVQSQVEAEYDPGSVRYKRCLAELLRAFGGSTEAAAHLRALDAEEPGPCTAMLVELAPAERRTRLAEDGSSPMADLLRWTMGLQDNRFNTESAEALLARPSRSSTRDAYLPWLVAAEAEMWQGLGPWHRAQLLRWRAAREIFDGRPEAARETAREAAAVYEAHKASVAGDPDRRYPSRVGEHIRFLPAAIELYTPGTEAVRALRLDETMHSDPNLAIELDLRFTSLAHRGSHRFSRSWVGAEYASGLQQAQRGEGLPLARAIGAPHKSWEEIDVMAVLPRVQHGREALARELAWRTSFRYESASVAALAIHAAVRRDALKLAGLPAEAARWDAIYRRCDAVLRDRRRLVALMLWEA